MNINRNHNLDSIFSFTDISVKTQEHLTKVYSTLALTIGAFTTGIIIAPTLAYSFFLQIIAIIATFFLVYKIYFS